MKVGSVVPIVLVCLISSSSWAELLIDDREVRNSDQEGSIFVDRTNSGSIQMKFPGLASSFIENRGQLEDDYVRYYALLDYGRVAFIDGGVLINIEEPPARDSNLSFMKRDLIKDGMRDVRFFGEDTTRSGCTVRLDFEGAGKVRPTGRCKLQGESTFFLGNDPSRWRTGVPNYGEVVYEDLYSGIDLVYRLDPSGMKYEFIVAPGKDPTNIRITLRGHDSLDIQDNEIIISTAIGEILDAGLVAFYEDSPSEWIDCSFEPRGKNTYGFRLPRLHHGRTLVIDPLVYSTYVGSINDDECEAIKMDEDGNSIVTGYTWSAQFPTTPGAYDTEHDGSYCDGFVTKHTKNGTSLVWSTFIGGSKGDSFNDLVIDSVGNVYLGGGSGSDDFPISQGAFQNTSCGGLSDGVVCKLGRDGTKLLYSTYLGGRDLDYIDKIVVDDTGSAYLCGHIDYRFSRMVGQNLNRDFYDISNTLNRTMIQADSSFPVTSGAYCTTEPGGNYDGFVCKVNPTGTGLVYSTYLGGEDIDVVSSIVVDGTYCAYVCGGTNSLEFPHTPRAFQGSPNGNMDAFVTKISADGSSLGFSTFLGGEGYDNSVDIVLDDQNNAHLVGSTYSQHFPVTHNAYQTNKDSNIGCFITRMSADGSSIITSTFLGGRDNDEMRSLDIDDDGNVFTVGYTRSDDFPTTRKAEQADRKGESDIFITKLNSSYANLLYSTYLGGSQNDIATGVSCDGSWSAYVTGFTNSNDFPTTSGIPQPQLGGKMDGFIVKLNLDTVAPVAVAGEDIILHQHETAEFDGTGSQDNLGIVNWSWSFEYDGQHIVLFNDTQNFTFHTAGEYSITLTVRDEGGLEATDSLIVTVEDITPPSADAGINREVMQHDTVQFDGRSSIDNVGVINWTWKFTYLAKVTILHGPMPSFTFNEAGDYNVTLLVSDEAGNWAIDNVSIHVMDIDPPIANAGADITIDQHQTATMSGSLSMDNVGVVNWTWNFTYQDVKVMLYGPSPCFLFDDADTYSVLMTVTDRAGNKAVDVVMVEVRDITEPVVRVGPDQTIDQYERLTFDGTGSSDNVGIESWTWSFSHDGDSITLNGRYPEYTFKTTGVYAVTLRITDGAGNWATGVMLVTVRDNTDPVAVSGEDICIDQQKVVVFDGSSSLDNVGIVDWVWRFKYGGEVVQLTGMITTYTFHTAGEYTIALTVWDAARNNATDEVTVVVVDVTAPVADAGADKMVDQFTSVHLEGMGSFDNVGIVEWMWLFTYDGAPVSFSGETELFQFDVPGVYEIVLRVVDAEGNFNETSINITVRDIVPPVAVYNGNTLVRSGEGVTFDGSASTDNVGVVSWVWIFEEGGKTIEIEGETVVYTFDHAGEHKVTLIVGDAEGNVASHEFAVDVKGRWILLWTALIVAIAVILLIIPFFLRRRRALMEDSTGSVHKKTG